MSSHVAIALLYQVPALHSHLKDALTELGARVVYDSTAATFDRGALSKSGAEVVIVNLDPEVGDEFEHLDEDDLEGGRGSASPVVTVEITGLSLYTRHGVNEAERELGQRLVFDLTFEVDGCDATVTDRVDDTVDYREVCEQVALAAQERSYRTLERLCSAVADRMLDRFGADSVRVKAAKPEPPIPLPVEQVSVEVWKET